MGVKIKISCIIVFLFFSLKQCQASDDTNSTSFDLPEEIQHAICTIATADIEASANATIRRELRGVCTSKEVMQRLDELEQRLLIDIKAIKVKLQIEDTVAKPPETILLHKPGTTKSLKNKLVSTTTPSTKTPTAESKNLYLRNIEALKNNRTLHTTELGKSFLYFWKIYDITDLLKYPLNDINSGIFYVQNNHLQVTFHPSHMGTNYVALELKSRNNYVPKHRFVVLNQNSEKGDLSSQVLGISAPLFRVSSEKLSKGFIADDSLIVKVIVLLH